MAAFTLNKAQAGILRGHIDTVREAEEGIEEAVTTYNAKLTEAKAFIQEIAEAWRSEFDDKSDAWQEGDKGSEANELIEAFEAISQDHDEIVSEMSGAADDLEALE